MTERNSPSKTGKGNKGDAGSKVRQEQGVVSVYESAQGCVRAFAEQVGHNLHEFLGRKVLAKELQRQWEHSQQAVLPLVLLGHEEDLRDLWAVVRRLDPRYLDYPDLEEEEALSVCRLESALDSCGAQIIKEAKPSVAALCPAIGLKQGLIDGFWCIAALLPRDCWKPPAKPQQLSLF